MLVHNHPLSSGFPQADRQAEIQFASRTIFLDTGAFAVRGGERHVRAGGNAQIREVEDGWIGHPTEEHVPCFSLGINAF